MAGAAVATGAVRRVKCLRGGQVGRVPGRYGHMVGRDHFTAQRAGDRGDHRAVRLRRDACMQVAGVRQEVRGTVDWGTLIQDRQRLLGELQLFVILGGIQHQPVLHELGIVNAHIVQHVDHGPRLVVIRAGRADEQAQARQERAKKDALEGHHTLNRKCITSPSFTTYSFPSTRSLPAALAPASPLYWMKSSKAITSARMKPFSKSLWITPAACGAVMP